MEDRYATGKLARLSAPFPGLLPDLSFAGNDPQQIHPLASGLATAADRGAGRRVAGSNQDQEITGASRPAAIRDDTGPAEDQSGAARRITLRPHDPSTGEEVGKEEVVTGYEYQRGQFVTFTAEELKAFDAESSKVIGLEKFVPRGELDPVYLNSAYYLYPDGPIAAETLRVIGAAMAEAGVVGLGMVTIAGAIIAPSGPGYSTQVHTAIGIRRPCEI